MKISRLLVAFAVLFALSGTAVQAQEPPPRAPFKAVHLVTLTDAQVATLQAALADINAAIAKAGHPDIRYRLYKVTGQQSGAFNYLWESSWPSGEVYQMVHNTPDYQAAVNRHPGLEALTKREVYNRYIEVAVVKK